MIANDQNIHMKRGHERVAINLRNIPRALRFQFKSLCADEEITMESALLAMIEDAVTNQTIPGIDRN